MSITAQGFAGGQVTFDGQFVEISKRGAAAFISASGNKRVHVSRISGVQIKPATRWTNGFIQFTIPGGNEVRAQWGRQSIDASRDENSVIFDRKREPQFLELRDAIEKAIVAAYTPT